MRDQHEIAVAGEAGDLPDHGGVLRGRFGGIFREQVERGEGLGLVVLEGEARRVQRPTVAAGQHPVDRCRARREQRADLARLLPAAFRKLLLGGADVDVEAGRVAAAGDGGMAQQHGMAAVAQQRPARLCRLGGRCGKKERQGRYEPKQHFVFPFACI